MIDPKKLMRNSKGSSEITFQTNKPVPQGPCVFDYGPFSGTDGKNYIIGYDRRLYESTNCYAFAMGWQWPSTNPYEEYIPGFLTGQQLSIEKAEELVRLDLAAVGRTVYEVVYDVPQHLPEGEGYWIKLLNCPEKDPVQGIHFMRKDKKSGRWLHKAGWLCPPKLVTRKLEFKDTKQLILERPEFQGIAENVLEQLLSIMFPAQMSAPMLVRSEVETDDSSGYVAWDENNQIFNYQTVWAMRVSEPK